MSLRNYYPIAFVAAAALVVIPFISERNFIEPGIPAQQQIERARKSLDLPPLLIPEKLDTEWREAIPGYSVACFFNGKLRGISDPLEENQPPPENYDRGLKNGDCIQFGHWKRAVPRPS